MILRLCVALALELALRCGAASAHEVRPAYLELVETAPGRIAGTWKQPVLDGRRLRIDPVLPADCEREGARFARTGGVIVERWTAQCDLSAAVIGVAGLDRTLTDVFLRVSLLDGRVVTAVLQPGAQTVDLAEAPPAPVALYFTIGVEHILFGLDHLLFVFGLVLLVRPRQLLGAVTAFTLAHSATLAAASLGFAQAPGPPVEIAIALSLSLLGIEILNKRRGRPGWAARAPWTVAFIVGLVHGFGFAGALDDIGLPKGAELGALVLFNLGVEAGQLAFVAALLAVGWAISRFRTALEPVRAIGAYAVGVTGLFWAMERTAAIL